MKTFTFHNVEITVQAEDAKEAYKILCDAIAVALVDNKGIVEYTTDTYSECNVDVEDGFDSTDRDTEELFPED